MYRGIALVRRSAAILALAAGLSGMANAGTMDFESTSMGTFLTAPFDQNGIRLSLIGGHYDLWSCTLSMLCPPANGIAAGLDAVQSGPSTVKISLIDGSLFNLDSIQILNSHPASFMQASSGSLYSFGSTGGTFTGLPGFQGIQFFDISSNVDIAGGFLFDNIAMTEVPELPTCILLLLPLVTLACFGLLSLPCSPLQALKSVNRTT